MLPRSPANQVSCLVGDGRTTVSPINRPGRSRTLPGDPGWSAALAWATRILATHGVKLGEKLGTGSYGSAFVNGTDASDTTRVVKVTGDASEAAAAQSVLDAIAADKITWGDLPALGRIDCVYALGEGSGPDLYVINQERVAGDLHPEAAVFVNNHRFAIALRKSEAIKQAREVGPDVARNTQRVMKTIEALNRVGIQWEDVSSGNVLLGRTGNWTVVDLGASNSAGTAVPALVERCPCASR